MRLYHTLFTRLRCALRLSHEISEQQQQSQQINQTTALNDDFAMQNNALESGFGDNLSSQNKNLNILYLNFINSIHLLLNNSIDNTNFEEFCYKFYGNKSYILYTIDKIIVSLVKHLLIMVNDENCSKLIGLFVYHHFTGLQPGECFLLILWLLMMLLSLLLQ